MKKLFLTFVLILGIANVASAQRLLGVQEDVDYVESSAREYSFSHNILTTPLVADLELTSSERIWESITYERKVSLDLIPSIPAYKALALATVAKNNDADLILGALVNVTTTAEGKLEITISGYPAKYVNFRKPSGEDLDIISEATIISSYGTSEASIIEKPDLQTAVLKENIMLIK